MYPLCSVHVTLAQDYSIALLAKPQNCQTGRFWRNWSYLLLLGSQCWFSRSSEVLHGHRWQEVPVDRWVPKLPVRQSLLDHLQLVHQDMDIVQTQDSICDVASCMIHYNTWENLELYENLHRSAAGSEPLQQVKNKLGKYQYQRLCVHPSFLKSQPLLERMNPRPSCAGSRTSCMPVK